MAAVASGWLELPASSAERAKTLLPVIVELEAGSKRAHLPLPSSMPVDRVPTVYRSNGTTHCTALLTVAHCSRLLRAGASDGPVRRLELQAPLIPQRPRIGSGSDGGGWRPQGAKWRKVAS